MCNDTPSDPSPSPQWSDHHQDLSGSMKWSDQNLEQINLCPPSTKSRHEVTTFSSQDIKNSLPLLWWCPSFTSRPPHRKKLILLVKKIWARASFTTPALDGEPEYLFVVEYSTFLRVPNILDSCKPVLIFLSSFKSCSLIDRLTRMDAYLRQMMVHGVAQWVSI